MKHITVPSIDYCLVFYKLKMEHFEAVFVIDELLTQNQRLKLVVNVCFDKMAWLLCTRLGHVKMSVLGYVQ